MKKLLITGGTGLIGIHFIQQVSKTYQVYSIQRGNRYSDQNTTVILGDLSKNYDYTSVPTDIDAIVYLAQSENFRLFPEKAADVFNVNTANLLEALDFARRSGVKKFIYASSGGVYGNSSVFKESAPIIANNDLGFYLSTKLCSEILTDNYRPFMDVVVLRFFFVYGKGQKRSMLVPRLVDSVREGREIVLTGAEGISINPTHVSDAVMAIQAALEISGSHKINIGGPDVITLKEVGEIIGKAVGMTPKFKLVDAPAQVVVGNISLMKDLLASPKVRFEAGVLDVLN